MAERSNQQSSAGQNEETRQPTRTQSGIARRHAYDPFSLPFGGDLLSPFSMMRRMMEDFDRAWGSMSSARSSGGGGLWTPAVEVSQRGDHFVVSAELPGLNKDDVRVEATDDELIIEGERKQEYAGEEGGIHRTERRYGHFYRAIPLPENAKAEKANARFNNGVLEVTIPVDEQKSNRRRIPLESGGEGGAKGSSGGPSGSNKP
jgi:HSP20 family protein